jgi:2-polyprenyl-3-methyl-5-hydroxy-6-metoxy-1,4-benzoquinol methylase
MEANCSPLQTGWNRVVNTKKSSGLTDTGERIIPPQDGEVSFVFARHQFAYQFAKDHVKDKKVIDVGCGTGYGCKTLAENARYVVGVDHDLEALKYCERNFGARNIFFAQTEALSLGLAKTFEAAVSFQVIEHVNDVAGFIGQLKSAVESGGTIFISTPNVPKRKQSRGNPFHQWEFDHVQFRRLISDQFSSFDILGVVYQSQNLFRSSVQSLPFYRWAAHLKRSSKIKRLANRALDMTSFRVSNKDLEKSLDLLAVCRNA